MKTYAVKIVKYGTELVEAESEFEARNIALRMESEAAFYMEMDITVSDDCEQDEENQDD